LERAKALLEAEAAARRQRYQQRVAALAGAARARDQQPRAHIRPRRRDEAPNPKATVNTTDPDSRFVRGNGRTLQGYNAQAAATTAQVVVAAELTQHANDLQQLAPMLAAIGTTLTGALNPGATACGRRCGPGWIAPRVRPAMPSVAGPSNQSSGR
jgi:hypothetical protein